MVLSSSTDVAAAGGGAAAGDGETATVASAASMDHDVAAAMARHWWYRGRAATVAALLRRAGAGRGGRVLDYGCGTGHMGRALARFGEVYGVDGEQAALDAGTAIGGYGRYAWVGRATLGCTGADVANGAGDDAVPSGPFTVIACLDVLEHVPDDAGLLCALTGRLARGGFLVVSVPVRPDLFCEIDRIAGHVRRYSPARLARLFADAGLRPVAGTGYVVALLPAAVLHRRRILAGRGAARAELVIPAAPLNAALSAVAVAEGRLARFVSLPPGLSQITVLCREDEMEGAASPSGGHSYPRPEGATPAERVERGS
jgi:SAM-dependent methyltransferase